MPLSQEQRTALQTVYQAVAPDIPDDYSPDEVAELLIDASRLTIHGFPVIQNEMSLMIKAKGYDVVLKMIAKEMYL